MVSEWFDESMEEEKYIFLRVSDVLANVISVMGETILNPKDSILFVIMVIS